MISVIIPFYNRSELFKRLFDSLNSIVEVEAEILFVDNGSETEARNCVQQFVDDFNSTHTLVSARIITETKPGSTAARNKGLREAKGDYVYFFDSDDWFSPTMLIKAYELAESTGVDAVAIRTNMVMPDGQLRNRNMVNSSSAVYQIVGNNFATQSLFLKSDFAKKYAFWDESLFYWNDLEWGLRILLAHPTIAWLDGIYHKIYKHSDSITGKSFSDSVEKILLVHSVMASKITESDLSQKEKIILHRALNCRKALYAGHVYREDAHAKAIEIYKSIDHRVSTKFHLLKLKILYMLSKRGVPGVWRMAVRSPKHYESK